jgi:hypothetical protein
MNKFNLRIFMIAAAAIVLLNFASLSGLEAYNTHNTSHQILSMMGSLWRVLRFPVFTFFWKLIYGHFNIFLFSTGIFINSAFYAVIIERIFYLLRKKQKFPHVPNGI